MTEPETRNFGFRADKNFALIISPPLAYLDGRFAFL